MRHYFSRLAVPFFSLVVFLCGQNLIDGIAAIVGEHVILKSDVAQLVQMTALERRLDTRFDMDKLEQIQGQVLQSLINQKLILEIAEVESIEVEDREVDRAVEQYINQSVAQAGSEEQIERMLGKKVSELRREWWPDMREQLIAERYQAQLFKDITVTGDEVIVFYNNYSDSLKTIPTMYNISHAFFKLRPGSQSRHQAYELASSLKKMADKGEDFAQMAEEFSEDPGSARHGGVLGFVSRGTLVPAFERVAYSLEPGEISAVVETEFGYHIIEPLEVMGDKINIRHILITPKVSHADEDSIYNFATTIRDSIVISEDFSRFAREYSNDASTRETGGRLGWIDPEVFPVEAIGKVLPSLELGVPSPPVTTQDGFHLLLVHEVREGGVPTLETHWTEIEALALARKKTKHFNTWLQEVSSSIFVENLLREP